VLQPLRFLTFSVLAALSAIVAIDVAGAAEGKVSFSRDIKPILAGRCFACHGPDDAERKAELRLDEREAAVESLAFVPGKSAESEVLKRITSTDPETMMPPAASKKPALSKDEIELIGRWIDQGAEYDAHWAYIKPQRPEVPQLAAAGAEWPINPIDNFLLAAMTKHGLQPSAEADKRTLLRRLSFDVIGLPPTSAEVAAFEADTSAEAYAKQVDRLLGSKHFGERMAMYWLDVVRFADTAGYHSDNQRDIAPFRDYTIQAFNNNKPFDQFTREQLAGDLLPNATTEQRIASGYNKLLQTTEEGGAQAKEYTAKYQADRVRNTSVIWLASTMGCCECHTHKFDPFTIKDFYSFAAFFADVQERAVGRQDQTKVPTSEQEAELSKLDARLAELKVQYAATSPELDQAQVAWENEAKSELGSTASIWQIAKPEKVESSGRATLEVQDDLSVLATGENPAKDNYTVTLPTAEGKLTGVRLEALTDKRLTNSSLSRANGNFVLTEVKIDLTAADGKATRLKVAAAEADFSQASWPVAGTIDGNNATGWAVDGHNKAENRAAMFVFDKPVDVVAGSKLVVTLEHQSAHAQHNIGKFRLSTTALEKPTLSGSRFPAEVVAALSADSASRNDAQKKTLTDYFRTVAPMLKGVRDEIAAVEQQRTALSNAFPTTLVSMATAPRTVRVLARGNWLDDSGEEVKPAVPGFLAKPSSDEKRLTRLDLADWIVSRENPLAARVFANRLWKLAFGRGIVKSLEDFGMQGEMPTHPELLDWLAVEFMDSGWDVKHLYKLMLVSRAYRQQSVPSAEQREKDPTNIYLSHQNRFRLDAEMVRDNALAVSKLLVPEIGGPSVKPYQPRGYWQYLNFPTREWENDKGENQYRRGLYTFWQRTFLHPSLLAFDAPSREECVVDRPRSNTPQQALVLLNDPTYVEAARALAARIVQEGGDETAARIEFAFREVLNRQAREDEAALLSSLYAKNLQQYQADGESAKHLQTVGDLQPPQNIDPAELAAWTAVSRVLLNLHETITRN
jgi:mono/diheme cytochrome c family protein